MTLKSLVISACGLKHDFYEASSIYMRAVYEEFRKSWKKLEKVGTIGKNWESIFLTVYEALHMKIYEAPSYEFWRAAIAGKRRAVPGSTRSAGQRREASGSVRELRK